MKINTELIKRCSSKNLLPVQSNDDLLERITHLYLQEQHIKRIENLEDCKNLIALYLYENNIEKIENLDQLYKLNCLYLHRNAITHIENLDMLTQLTVLNLSHNSISRVEGLEALCELRELHIQYQNLPHDQSLEFDPESITWISVSLRVLNVSGNKLKSFSPLKPLVCLENFTAEENQVVDLPDLLDAISGWNYVVNMKLSGNPVCRVRKYRDNIVVTCLELEELDSKAISPAYRNFLLNWKQCQTLQHLKKQSYEVLKPFLETRKFLTTQAAKLKNGTVFEISTKHIHGWCHRLFLKAWQSLKHNCRNVNEFTTSIVQTVSSNFNTNGSLLGKCSSCGSCYYAHPVHNKRENENNDWQSQESSGYWLYVENTKDRLEELIKLNDNSLSLKKIEDRDSQKSEIGVRMDSEPKTNLPALKVTEQSSNFSSTNSIKSKADRTKSCGGKIKSAVIPKPHIAPYFLRSTCSCKH